MKEEGEVTEYVECMIKKKQDTIYLHQTDLIKRIEWLFGKEIENTRNYKTPGASGEGIVRMTENKEGLNDQGINT